MVIIRALLIAEDFVRNQKTKQIRISKFGMLRLYEPQKLAYSAK